MATAQELRDKRASVWEKMKEIMDRNGDMTAEDRAAYDTAEVELDDLGDQIERQERHDARTAALNSVDRSELVGSDWGNQKGDDQERYSRAFTEMLRNGLSELDPEDKKILRTGFVDKRALGVGTPAAGGYTVPADFRNRLIEQMRTFGGMLQVSEILTTDTGASLSWPTNDDTANKGAILAENTAVTEQDVTLGTASIDAYKYTSKMIRVSLELLQDSAFNVDSWLTGKLAERIARILNEHFTTGTGTNQPDGLVTGTPVGKVGAAGQVTTVTYDDLIDLIDSIDPAYQGNAQFMLSQSSRKALRKLKDSTGSPLWQPTIQAGVPDQLLGYRYVVNQELPVPAASAKSILFGDFRQAYVIRQVRDVQVLRLTERFADYFQVGFLGFMRADGTVQNTSAVRAYQHPAA
jgi:HK97 family phage major capsid protein